MREADEQNQDQKESALRLTLNILAATAAVAGVWCLAWYVLDTLS